MIPFRVYSENSPPKSVAVYDFSPLVQRSLVHERNQIGRRICVVWHAGFGSQSSGEPLGFCVRVLQHVFYYAQGSVEPSCRTPKALQSLRGNRIGATGLRPSERKSASERVSEREGFQRFLRGFERFLEVFRDFERFSEVFRGFERFFRGFQRFLRGFQRSSQRPSQRQISSQRLSVLLPLIVLPLELSPKNTFLSTSDFQSEVGEVFGEIGGELPAKFGRRFSSFFCWGNRQKHFPPKLYRKFHHRTSLRGFGLWRALRFIESGKGAEIAKISAMTPSRTTLQVSCRT